VSTEKITFHDEAGQVMSEYAVVLGVITVAIVTTFAVLSGAINEAFRRILDVLGPVF
jgi:Flp pilus assembly pilin Flp